MEKKCFIISPIGQDGSETRKHADDVFEYIIKPAMDECKINAYRSDHLDKPGRISEQMFQSIYTADLCVAILTGYNPNVFYELAVAQSANRPVIILIEKGQQLPFDISDLRCVYYDLEIRSYKEQSHIKRIINYVRDFENAEWAVNDFFNAYRTPAKQNVKDIEVFEAPIEYGTEATWGEFLKGASSRFDIMGITLTRWRKTANFIKIVTEKATGGCKFRILMMHESNQLLKGLDYSDSRASYDAFVHDIDGSYRFYQSLAQKSPNIEIRQMRIGNPHFYLAQSDQAALMIQYLSFPTWSSGPILKCCRKTKLYNIVKQEFEAFWEMCEPK